MWFFVVKLWWIAGESWEVDGQFLGSKNMSLFPDLFFDVFPFWEFGSASILSVLKNGYGRRTDVDQYRIQSGGMGVINS